MVCLFVVLPPYREEPGAGNIITFFQFLFIAAEGFIFVTNFCQRSPQIPIRSYITLVGLYFTVSVVNNFAFNFDIPLPLHMIFRAVGMFDFPISNNSPLLEVYILVLCYLASIHVHVHIQSYIHVCDVSVDVYAFTCIHPTHTQGSLIANMALGIIILKRQ